MYKMIHFDTQCLKKYQTIQKSTIKEKGHFCPPNEGKNKVVSQKYVKAYPPQSKTFKMPSLSLQNTFKKD
jgi:hypothetical protein